MSAAPIDRLVTRWKYLEEGVSWPAAKDDTVRAAWRSSGILVTAPHQGIQIRDGVTKRAEAWTGSLALLMGEECGVSALVGTCGPYKDPAWYPRTPFGSAYGRHLPWRAVIDVHGMREEHGCDICIGCGAHPTGVERAIATTAARLAFERGLIAQVNVPFAGTRPTSFATRAQRDGALGLQIELGWTARNAAENPQKAVQVAEWMHDVVALVQRELGEVGMPRRAPSGPSSPGRALA